MIHPRALRHVESSLKHLRLTDYLIRRYAHVDDFGETDNAFTICCFWLAEALARVGRADDGKEMFEKLGRVQIISDYLEKIFIQKQENSGETFRKFNSHVGLIQAAFQFKKAEEGTYGD